MFMKPQGLDGREQNAVGIVFEDVAVSSSFHDLLNKIVGFVHRQDEDFRLRRRLVNAPRGFHSIEQRHTDVEHRDIRLEFQGFFDGVTPIGGLCADLPPGPRFEQCSESLAHNRMVIGDEDAER